MALKARITDSGQKHYGPFHIDEGKKFDFLQNPTSNGEFSDGFSIRYFSRTCGTKKGQISLGTVKEPYIEIAKNTLELLYNAYDEEDFILYCKRLYRLRRSTTDIIIDGVKRKINTEWVPLINSFINELNERERENLEEQLEEQTKLMEDD